MKTEPVADRCPKCEAPLPANAPRGLCPKCLLAAVASPTEAGHSPDPNPPPGIAEVAAAFPQLEVIELIGQGGMGLVYKARQPKLDRLVALKLLPQALAADTAFAERFNREARVLARLNHPSIVTIHDFGQAGGFFFLLMEFVDGVNLRQAMQTGRFTPQQAMSLVPRICEALQFAHDEGILHRDIKPENILLDTRGRVKIADFGIAKLVGEAREQLALTASGTAVGTPHYMAPEQLEHPEQVDQRADIYSLGVVFYEMLTGELPIGRFAPPSQKSSVDPRVDEVVFHALEKEREKRFRSATEVKSSVEAITSTAMPSPNPASESFKSHGETAEPSGGGARSPCYFNTPQKMRDCFPSAAARIFSCKGELVLESDSLVFVSPWRTSIRIPYKELEDLSVGQFQMWTTPWVIKYARLNFLSVTFRAEGQLQIIHLTPVPPGAGSASQINAFVGRWFEQIREMTKEITGAVPHNSDPESLAISAEPAWNRKGLPLTAAMGLTWLAAWVLMPQASVGRGIWLPVLIISMVVFVITMWFCAGFLVANRALGRGDLDAVTSEDPPSSEPALEGNKRRAAQRWLVLNPSALGLIAAALLIPIGMLIWEAWVLPSFGEKIVNKRHRASSSSSSAQCVVDVTMSLDSRSARQLAEARSRLTELARLYTTDHPLLREQSELVRHLEKSSASAAEEAEPARAAWNLKCLVPPGHRAQVLFVRWTDGVRSIQPGLSAYFKTGHAPAQVDFSISYDRQPASGWDETNQLLWNVNLGLGYTSASLFPAKPGFKPVAAPARMKVRSGHQLVMRLLDYPQQEDMARNTAQDGVELRLILEPLSSPAMKTVPSEKELNHCIGGAGVELSESEVAELMKRLPVDL